MDALTELLKLQDKGYAEFQARLIPGMPKDKIIGVRVPEVRKLAKAFIKEDYKYFMDSLPHQYYDENMLHGVLISEMKDYEECVSEVDKFLPYVEDWAVCDIMSPKIFKKHKTELIEKIREWSKSEETFTCRFGIEMLMSFYLDEDFESGYLEIPATVRSTEYYVNMMVAWFFATALSKQWDASIKYITEKRLDEWTHNKTIQKACESYRITAEQKAYLRELKIKKEK